MKSKSKSQKSSSLNSCEKHLFTSSEAETIRPLLLSWYDEHKRTLPWRTIADSEPDDGKRGYGVWVSEIMCQQTQVATVIDYFNRWMSKWPTVDALSKASLDEVNQMWSGLGYYSRGKRLWEGSQKISENFGGILPKTNTALMKEIPGVGRYTASAIASIAFKQPVGVVDGNVIRVISRMRAIGADVTSQDVIERLWMNADCLVDPSRPGDLNQSLMELGATVCTPKGPSCEKCPVKAHCLAHLEVQRTKSENQNFIANKPKPEPTEVDIEDCGLCLQGSYQKDQGVLNYPRKTKKAAAREETLLVCVLWSREKFCLFQRPSMGLLANLLEFPSFKLDDGIDLKSKVVSATLKSELCIDIATAKQCGELTHVFSHIKQKYLIWSAKLDDEEEPTYSSDKYQGYQWLDRSEIEKAAISTAVRKILKLYDNEASQQKKTMSKRKSEAEKEMKGQSSITTFFNKRVKTE